MKKFVVEMMISSYKGAKRYYDEAVICEDPDARRVFKELAIGETSEFDKLCQLYKNKHGATEQDFWMDYFREEVMDIRKKIAEIA